MTQKNYTSLGWRVLQAFGVIYIAVIGVFAIEELRRRDRAGELFAAHENEIATALAAIGNGSGARADEQRAQLDKDRARLRGLRARLDSLILAGARHDDGTLSHLMCDWIRTKSPEANCSSHRKWYDDISAKLVLKRAAESRASGDVFALLVIIAAIGGALIRRYLPHKPDHASVEADDGLIPSVLRAIGGGTVCYLVLTGGNVPFTGYDAKPFASPATSLSELLCNLTWSV